MKRIMKRTLALLLCGVLLCSSLPLASAASAPDFQALLEAGEQNNQNVIYTVTEPIYYTAEVGRFVGDYAIYQELNDGHYGIVDYKGNIVLPPQPWELAPKRIYGENLFLANNGYLYDFQGNKLYEQKAGGEIGLLRDAFTGETLGYWIGETDTENGRGCKLVRDFSGRQETATNITACANGMITYFNDYGEYGLKMLFGEELLPCEYSSLMFSSGDTLLFWKDGACGKMRPDGTVTELYDYDTVTLSRVDRERTDLIVSKDGKYGVCSLEGQVLIPLEYDSISGCDYNNFHYRGELDGESWLISEDKNLTFCGTRNFPMNTTVLYEHVYYIDQGDSAIVVNENNERLIPETLAPWYYGKVGSSWVLQLLDEDALRLYNQEMELLAVLPGTDYQRTRNSLVRNTVDSEGVSCVEFYSSEGELLTVIRDVELDYLQWKEYVLLRRNNKLAIASCDGTMLTDFVYTGADEISSGWDELHYPYVGTTRDGGASHSIEIIDGRIGKNALGENCYVLEDALLLPEGSYFAYYKDGKTGFARLTSRTEPPFKDVKSSSWYAEPATFCFNAGLMNGTGDGCFSPKMEMTRAMLVQVLYSISGEKTESFGFTDVPDGKWYSDAVNWAAANEIVAGLGDGKFGPNEPVTRQQIVTMLFKYASLYRSCEGDPAILEAYDDAGSVSSYARTPLAWAVENGMVSGITPTTIEPKMTATRAQIATLLMRFIEYMAAPTEP